MLPLFKKSLFQLDSFLFLNFNLLFKFSCFLGNLQVLFCYNVLMTFSRSFSLVIGPTSSSCASACNWHCAFCSFGSLLLLGLLCSPAVGCALLRLDSSLLLCSADLLLVVVQVLRFCVPFRQSGFASFVNFFSSLTLLAVVLSLFSVFWRRLLQHYRVAVYCSEVRLLHVQRHYSTCVTSWSLVRGRCSGSSTL